MNITKMMIVKARWDSFTYPVKRGTPLNAKGAVTNGATAVGIVIQDIAAKPDDPEEQLWIMTGGSAKLSELGYELSNDAMRNMNGIVFYGADGTPAVDPVYVPYTLPAASADAIGGVKMAANVADAAGEAPTAEEFKALLDALKEAGIMEADAAT